MKTGEKFWHAFEVWVLRVLQIFLAVGIITAIAMMAYLLFEGVVNVGERVDTVSELQRAVQSLFAGVLLVVLGLELMETLRNYFVEHRLRVEFLVSVALIAVARHVIQIDYEHTSATTIVGLAALIVALSGGYVLIRRYGHA